MKIITNARTMRQKKNGLLSNQARIELELTDIPCILPIPRMLPFRLQPLTHFK